MRCKLKSILVACILVFSGFVIFSNFCVDDISVQGATLYVGPTSTYKNIQDAVDNASTNDIIYVDNGTYYESVTISTSGITLIGNSTTDCKIIHSYVGTSISNYAAGINISANNITITGFNISVSGDYTFGICFKSFSENSTIINNNITTTGNHGYGIFLELSSNNELIDNKINTSGSNGIAFFLYYSSYNDIIGNTINTSGNGDSIYVRAYSDHNNITDNIIRAIGVNGGGIQLDLCSSNILTNNIITTSGNNGNGIYLDTASKNNLTGNIINTYSTSIHLRSNSNNNNLTNNVINSTGDLKSGIYLEQNLDDNNLSNNIINTYGDRSPGINLGINNKNYNIKNNTIYTSGLESYGISLRSATKNNLIGNKINTNGQDGYGIYLYQNSNNNNFTGNTINTSGPDGYGIYLEQSSNNKIINDNKINTSGLNGNGIYLEQSSNNKNINGNTINIFGSSAYGIFLDQASNNTINDNIIRTINQDVPGIYLWDSCNNNDLTGNTINTTGINAYGIYLYLSCNYNNLTGNTINTTGLNGWGITSRASSIRNNITDNTVYTSGSSGWGIFVYLTSNNNNLTDNEIYTMGTDAYGIYIASSNDVNITNNSIITTQTGARGIYMEIANNTSIMNCNISTTGSNAHGIGMWGMKTTVENSKIVSTNANDFRTRNDGNITAINCSFNTVEAANGVLLVKNYLSIQAYYNDSITPIPNADVVVEDNGLVIYSSVGYGGTDPQTNTIGQVDNVLIMDRWYYYSNMANENITNISVKKTVDMSWEEIRTDVDMSSSHTELFISTNIIAPSTPSGLMVSQVPGTNNLSISWNLNPEVDILNYTIYTNKTGQWSILANITHPINSTLDIDLPDETWYFYRIQAWDIANLPSGISLPGSYYLGDATPPAIPSGLGALPVPGGDALNITWNLNTDDTVNYSLWWRDSPTGIWMLLGNFSNTTSWFVWENENLVNGTKHYFKLRAWDEVDIPSDFTNEIIVTHRDYEPPNGPTNLVAGAVSETEINLTWSASTSTDVEKYWIFMNHPSAGAGGPYQFKGEVNGQTLEYQVTGLLENGTYYFILKAFDEANNPSLNSNEASDTTLSVHPNAPILDTLPKITNMQIQNVTGTAELGVTILIYNNGVEVGNGTTNTTGGFGIKISLLEGDNDINARAFDQVMLPSKFSVTQTVRLDITNPIANAGNDLNITKGTEVTFNGTASTDNYEIVNYTWSFLYGGSAKTLFGSKPSFLFDQVGDYEVTLKVTDSAGNMGMDTVIVKVTEKVVPDTIPPLANAGADQQKKVGDKVTFDGSGSTDNTGISNYTWTFTYNGTEVVLHGVSPSFIFELVGNYELTLTVIDLAIPPNMGTDTMWVNVTEVVSDSDTDNDNMPDAWEDDYGLDKNDPLDAAEDADTDDLNNLDEYKKSTDPNNPDSDDDNLPDGWEVKSGLDPTNPTDAGEDLDGDGYTNLEEFKAGTNPQDDQDKPKEETKDEDKETDNTLMYLALIVIVIIIIVILAFALTRGKKAAEAEVEEALTDEEAEEPMADDDSELEDEDIDEVEEPEFDEELEDEKIKE